MADFDFKKYLIESKINIKVPVKEMARIAKEKYKLNTGGVVSGVDNALLFRSWRVLYAAICFGR